MALSGTTQLEAVNTLLHTIGEAPVNSLTGTLPIDATLALNTINEISREVQAAGWHFNSIENCRDKGEEAVSLMKQLEIKHYSLSCKQWHYQEQPSLKL